MDIFSIFKVAGGIGLFLYGMKVMGNAIGRQAGGKFKKILENITASPVRSVLLGAGITAIIQSSAATSVMVLGFVNSGIMSLESSIGLIMGANIGTTATGWILSLNSISGTSFFLKLLTPNGFVPLLACIGSFIILFSKNEKKQDIAKIIIGFAVLMYGMTSMQDALKPLTGSEEFKNILLMFSNPILGVLVGFAITAVTQSSSASIGILQAISVTGGITFLSAMPIVMGINIGAVLVVILASLGSSREAKRVACIDFLFNLIGTIICLSVYWILNSIFEFKISNAIMGYVSIAMLHTGFKILITVILLPFRRFLMALSKIIIRPTKEETKREKLLDDLFLSTPTLAISRCRDFTVEMAKMAKKSIFLSMDSVYNYNQQDFNEVMELEDKVDNYEDKLGSYMLKISTNRINTEDSHEVSRLLHCIGDFERISDHAVNIMQSAQEISEKNLSFSDVAKHDLNVMFSAVKEILDITINTFEKNSVEDALMVEPLEEVVDLLKVSLKSRHITRLQQNECSIVAGFIFSDLITSCERIADHCSNIAVYIIELSEENFDIHTHLKLIKNGNPKFNERYNMYLKKYQI